MAAGDAFRLYWVSGQQAGTSQLLPVCPSALLQASGNPIKVQQAKDLEVLYDSLQVRQQPLSQQWVRCAAGTAATTAAAAATCSHLQLCRNASYPRPPHHLPAWPALPCLASPLLPAAGPQVHPQLLLRLCDAQGGPLVQHGDGGGGDPHRRKHHQGGWRRRAGGWVGGWGVGSVS